MERAAEIINWHGDEMTRITEAAGYAEVATQAHRLSNLLWRAYSEEIMQGDRSYLTKGGWVQVHTLISQRMKSLWENPALQEKTLKLLERREHMRMCSGTQCAVNPRLGELYAD